MSFRESFEAACRARASHLCVGLDPDLDLLPEGFVDDPDDVLRFVQGVVDATAEFAAAFKPNSAFYEVMGPAGMEVLQAVIAAIPTGIPVILDAKRGDVDNTAARYAQAAFKTFGAGAVTVNAYLGRDSLEPFMAYQDRGVFILCRTSNEGASDMQNLDVGGHPMYIEVARRAQSWDDKQNLGLVVGATWPEELAAIRTEAPDLPILVPGVGAQGGDVEASVGAAAGPSGNGRFVISASRSVMHASRGADYQQAAAGAARALRDRIEAAFSKSG